MCLGRGLSQFLILYGQEEYLIYSWFMERNVIFVYVLGEEYVIVYVLWEELWYFLCFRRKLFTCVLFRERNTLFVFRERDVLVPYNLGTEVYHLFMF